jgi:phage portal protein BeeE
VKDEFNNWLAPRFGEGLQLAPDLDKVEALLPRRQELWARIGGADFMTLNEKRMALGFDTVDGGDVIAARAG